MKGDDNMVKWYYMDEEFDTEEEALAACAEDVDEDDILDAINEMETDHDILTAIRKGDEQMYYDALEVANSRRADFFVCMEEEPDEEEEEESEEEEE